MQGMHGEQKETAQEASAQRLLASARRMTKATADMASVHGRLAAGIHIGNDEALSFQVSGLRQDMCTGQRAQPPQHVG